MLSSNQKKSFTVYLVSLSQIVLIATLSKDSNLWLHCSAAIPRRRFSRTSRSHDDTVDGTHPVHDSVSEDADMKSLRSIDLTKLSMQEARRRYFEGP